VKLADISGIKRRNIWKLKLINFKLTVWSKTLDTCIGASMILISVTRLELIQQRMRREIWLQTPKVFWLGGWIINVDFDATGQPLNIWRGAFKSLARRRRTESIVSLERGVCSCVELQVFSCYRGWKEVCQATRAIPTWRH